MQNPDWNIIYESLSWNVSWKKCVLFNCTCIVFFFPDHKNSFLVASNGSIQMFKKLRILASSELQFMNLFPDPCLLLYFHLIILFKTVLEQTIKFTRFFKITRTVSTRTVSFSLSIRVSLYDCIHIIYAENFKICKIIYLHSQDKQTPRINRGCTQWNSGYHSMSKLTKYCLKTVRYLPFNSSTTFIS